MTRKRSTLAFAATAVAGAIAFGNVTSAGAQELTVVSFGGAYQDGQSKALFQPAAKALGKIKSPEAMKALAVALDDRDPAMQYVGVQSLKSITGKDYGPDVQAWRQVAAGGALPAAPAPSIAERVRGMSPFK